MYLPLSQINGLKHKDKEIKATQSPQVVSVKMEAQYTEDAAHRCKHLSACTSSSGQRNCNFELRHEG